MFSELNIKNLSHWGYKFKSPLIISGPCSAESEEQVVETAISLSKQGIDIFRAGVWKPRTRPDSFAGVGSEGLKWLKMAGKLTNLLVTTEVANARHVEECLREDIDILWIGARTTVNPFAVQEIADALKGTDIPVFVKNPINPDIELWVGAFERLSNAGLTRLGAIHRGFSSYEKTQYRNKPNWEIPIELKRRIPGLSVICDPSHICGNREGLLQVSQSAIDLDFDGLMLESHNCPEKALSDTNQQVTPDDLGKILKQLVYRKAAIEDVLTKTFVEELRDTIDKIDHKIIEYLAQRMDLAKVIGYHKREHNITILQSERWDEVVKTRMKSGQDKELSEEFIRKLFELIHQEAIHHQNVVMNSELPNEVEKKVHFL
jgi:chorismate mutase